MNHVTNHLIPCLLLLAALLLLLSTGTQNQRVCATSLMLQAI
jgi:hypothetical protein